MAGNARARTAGSSPGGRPRSTAISTPAPAWPANHPPGVLVVCDAGGVAGLASGTVTFLFTDIESSSARWEADAPSMAGALALHDQILTSVIDGCGGTVFKHLGDGVCAAFSSAPAALKAAVECQGRLAAEGWGGGDRLPAARTLPPLLISVCVLTGYRWRLSSRRPVRGRCRLWCWRNV